jgi:hypothetical protein
LFREKGERTGKLEWAFYGAGYDIVKREDGDETAWSA